MIAKPDSLSTQIYEGKFTKQNGETRNMRFRRLSENFAKDRVGYETVWDEDKQEFRKFNWSTAIGRVIIT